MYAMKGNAMIEIPNTWEGEEQPDDEDAAGSPDYFLENYKIFQDGLELLLKDISRYSHSLKQTHNIMESGYEVPIKHLDNMATWGRSALADESNQIEITVKGVSWSSLRYLKAGILYLAVTKINSMAQNDPPPKTTDIITKEIEKIFGLANSGFLKGLRPADILFDTSAYHQLQMMERTTFDVQKVQNWMNDKWKAIRICPICKNKNWTFSDELMELSPYHEGPLRRKPVYPIFSLICLVCGYTSLFNAVVAGFVKQPEEDK